MQIFEVRLNTIDISVKDVESFMIFSEVTNIITSVVFTINIIS